MRRLYTFFRSSTSYRLRIALSLKGLEWEPHYVSLPRMEHRTQGYMTLNPQGLVPALIEDDGNVLAQSLAIMEYLDETYPEPALLPSDPLGRAYVRGLAQVIGCDIHPLNNTRVLKWLGARWEFTEDEVNEWYRHWIAEGMRSFEATLNQHKCFGTFCLGESVTLADVCLVPQIANARRFRCPLDDFPRSVAIAEAAEKLPAFKAAHPSTQADAG
jgi:maleylacetoacetate isomerase/maleylpyruvate isomerase